MKIIKIDKIDKIDKIESARWLGTHPKTPHAKQKTTVFDFLKNLLYNINIKRIKI